MKKILFHHLAKTAGTSLIETIQSALPDKVCNARYDAELNEELMLDSSFRFYHGHFSFRLVLRFKELNPDAFVFTFVRHPITRILSQYYNWVDVERVEHELASRNRGENPIFSRRREKFREHIFGMTLDQFLASNDPDILEVTRNHQSGYLSDESVKNRSIRYTAASDNLFKNYNFVGITEYYDAGLIILAKKTGLPFGSDLARRANTNDDKKSGGRYVVRSDQLDKMFSCNPHDIALYYSALTSFVKDYGSYIDAKKPFSEIIALPRIEL